MTSPVKIRGIYYDYQVVLAFEVVCQCSILVLLARLATKHMELSTPIMSKP